MIERLLAGEAALARDELDAADRLFEQVAEADPRNAIAVVGQARVALRRGDVQRGRLLAGQALVIDPDEAAARRLLEELDRQSGAAPQPPPGTEAAPEAEPAPETVAERAPEAVAERAPEGRSPLDALPGWEPEAPVAAATSRGWRAWLAGLLRRG